ncbi:hypothetical protein AAFP32_15140 [Brevibacterium sp. CBA3109]|uniref:Uncharacterized protein n=1 Tax=Brevibacterium koreense TaxID=3140787 RepID=A0AAU7UM53_9MICO
MHDCTDQGVPVPPTPSLPDTGVFPGERATTAHSFATRLADFAPELPVPVWKSLFRRTSGHLLAGQAVLQGADSMGRDLSTVDADHYSDLPSADVRTQIRCQAPDSPELRLAHLTILRRLYDAEDRHSKSLSRRALGAIAAEWLKAPAV